MNSNEINNLFDEYRAYNDAFYQKLVQIVKELASKEPNGILRIKSNDNDYPGLLCGNKISGKIYYCKALKIINNRIYGYVDWGDALIKKEDLELSEDFNWIDLFEDCCIEITMDALEKALASIADEISKSSGHN